MPEILPDHVPMPVCVIGWDGARYRAFALDATGQLNVNVLTNLGLDDALQSVATDRLQVRGEDQLFSIDEVVAKRKDSALPSDDGYAYSDPVPANKLWVITNVVAFDRTKATTQHNHYVEHDAVAVGYHVQVAAFPIDGASEWHGHVYLDPSDRIGVSFIGGQTGDSITIRITGYQMSQE